MKLIGGRRTLLRPPPWRCDILWFCGGFDVVARGPAVRSRCDGSSEASGGEVVCSGSLRCARHALEPRGQKFERLPPSTDEFRVKPLLHLIQQMHAMKMFTIFVHDHLCSSFLSLRRLVGPKTSPIPPYVSYDSMHETHAPDSTSESNNQYRLRRYTPT